MKSLSMLRWLMLSALALLICSCGSSHDSAVIEMPTSGATTSRELTLRFDYATDAVLGQIPDAVSGYQITIYTADGSIVQQKSVPGQVDSIILGAPTVGFLVRTTGLDSSGAVVGYADVSVAPGTSPVTLEMSTLVAGPPPTIPTFSNDVGKASRLAFLVHPTNVLVGQTFSVSVVALDATGQQTVVVGDNVNLALNGEGLMGETTVPFGKGGVARFQGLSVNKPGSTYTLTATLQGLSPATSLPFTVGSVSPPEPVATSLSIVSAPTAGTAGLFLPTSVEVRVLDQFGSAFTSSGVTVALALAQDPIPPTESALSGTLTAVSVNGVASFPGLSLNLAGVYRLQASANGLPSTTTGNMTITNPVAVRDIPLNETPDGTHRNSDIVADSNGNFVVAWEDGATSGNGPSVVRARRIGPQGAPVGSAFLIANPPQTWCGDVRLGALPSGGFVACWTEFDLNVFTRFTRLQRFDAENQPVGTVFSVETDVSAVVAAHPEGDGSYVLVYLLPGAYQLTGQRFGADGDPLGTALNLNDSGDGRSVSYPAVAADVAGNFIVTWEEDAPWNGSYELRVARFAADGTSTLSERALSASSTYPDWRPSVDLNAEGTAVVVYTAFDSGLSAIKGAVVPAGVGPGNEIVLTSLGPSAALPDVAVNADGTFALTWVRNGTSAMLARFNASALIVGAESVVLANTASGLYAPRTVANSAGVLGVTFTSSLNNVFLSLFPTGTP